MFFNTTSNMCYLDLPELCTCIVMLDLCCVKDELDMGAHPLPVARITTHEHYRLGLSPHWPLHTLLLQPMPQAVDLAWQYDYPHKSGTITSMSWDIVGSH